MQGDSLAPDFQISELVSAHRGGFRAWPGLVWRLAIWTRVNNKVSHLNTYGWK